METRKICSLDVSVVGLGTNNFGLSMDADKVGPVVDAALESGINFFDTADSYGES
jgi:aryl-alcohol dehydrogenase-like predicted oxidoreductase